MAGGGRCSGVCGRQAGGAARGVARHSSGKCGPQRTSPPSSSHKSCCPAGGSAGSELTHAPITPAAGAGVGAAAAAPRAAAAGALKASRAMCGAVGRPASCGTCATSGTGMPECAGLAGGAPAATSMAFPPSGAGAAGNRRAAAADAAVSSAYGKAGGRITDGVWRRRFQRAALAGGACGAGEYFLTGLGSSPSARRLSVMSCGVPGGGRRLGCAAGARARAGETAGDGMAASPGCMGVRGEPPPGRPVHSDRREETPFAAERVQLVAFGPPGSAPPAGEAPTGEAPPLPALRPPPLARARPWRTRPVERV